MNSGLSNLLTETLKKEKSAKVPFWFMRQAGRYLPEYREVRSAAKDFLSFCYTPDMATEVTLQPIRRFNMSAAIIFSDILVVPHALGMKVWFEEGEGPKLEPISRKDDIDTLSLSRVQEFLQPVYEAIKNTRATLGSDKALIGFAGAPWTLACYMLEGKGSKEFGAARQFSYLHPQIFSALIGRLTDAVIVHLKAQIRAGADAVQIFDSWAGLASEAQFNEWIIAPAKKIVAELKKQFPHIPIIGFPRMAGAHYANYVKETGIDAVSIDMQASLSSINESLPERYAVQGNLDPYLLASDGNESLVQAKRILAAFKDRPHIFNLGHGILPHTPISHVERLCEMLHAHTR